MPNLLETIHPTHSVETLKAGTIFVNFTEGYENGASVLEIDLTGEEIPEEMINFFQPREYHIPTSTTVVFLDKKHVLAIVRGKVDFTQTDKDFAVYGLYSYAREAKPQNVWTGFKDLTPEKSDTGCFLKNEQGSIAPLRYSAKNTAGVIVVQELSKDTIEITKSGDNIFIEGIREYFR